MARHVSAAGVERRLPAGRATWPTRMTLSRTPCFGRFQTIRRLRSPRCALGGLPAAGGAEPGPRMGCGTRHAPSLWLMGDELPSRRRARRSRTRWSAKPGASCVVRLTPDRNAKPSYRPGGDGIQLCGARRERRSHRGPLARKAARRALLRLAAEMKRRCLPTLSSTKWPGRRASRRRPSRWACRREWRRPLRRGECRQASPFHFLRPTAAAPAGPLCAPRPPLVCRASRRALRSCIPSPPGAMIASRSSGVSRDSAA